MGKKRKTAGQTAGPNGPKDVDPAAARLGQIRTFHDVADSQDEFEINQDRILLEDEPRSKRSRMEAEDDFLEPSDSEVLEDADDSSDDEEMEYARAPSAGQGRNTGEDSDEEQEDQEEQMGEGYWGSTRADYYNADALATEQDALEEEAEAKRIQEKKLSKMTEADFMFEEDEWLAPAHHGQGEGVITETLKDVEITEDMTAEQRYHLLQTRYPEFDYLAAEFLDLHPRLAIYKEEASGKPIKSLECVTYWVLGCYIAALASYFACLTSPTRDGTGKMLLDPAELRGHEVMETLVSCRETWLKVKDLKPAENADSSLQASPPQSMDEGLAEVKFKEAKESRSKSDGVARKKKAVDKAKLAKAKEIEDSLADLSTLLMKPKKTSKLRAPTASKPQTGDDLSDFGEEETLDARAAAEKSNRKKSLRFYTSQITQKANKRAGASRDAGGDMDIPYRERLRDRQARLNKEAERRGLQSSKLGDDLGDGSEDDDDQRADGVRDDADEEYYNLIAKSKKDRSKQVAEGSGQVTAREVVGLDGQRRLIPYNIEKNKGLTPKRKKENRNPRVKKRRKYDEKTKKLASMRAVYKGGEGHGGYQGELSGIKSGLIKSVKL